MGSEESLSKDLTLKYFDNDSYIEYDQGGINYFNRINYETLNTVVGNKIKTGYNICKTYNPDFIIFVKSNHFIDPDWLKFVVDDNNQNNYYGISLLSNVFFICSLTSENKIDHNDKYIWDNRNHHPIKHIDACLIAFPKKIYNN